MELNSKKKLLYSKLIEKFPYEGKEAIFKFVDKTPINFNPFKRNEPSCLDYLLILKFLSPEDMALINNSNELFNFASSSVLYRNSLSSRIDYTILGIFGFGNAFNKK